MQLFMQTFETIFVQIRQKYFKFWERKNEFLMVKELSSNLRAFRIENFVRNVTQRNYEGQPEDQRELEM